MRCGEVDDDTDGAVTGVIQEVDDCSCEVRVIHERSGNQQTSGTRRRVVVLLAWHRGILTELLEYDASEPG